MAKKPGLIKVALMTLLKALGTKLEEVKTDAGAVLQAESFEVGEPVFIIEGENQVPLPVGDYTLEDGRMLTVTEEGIIASIGEQAAPEEPPAEPAAAAAEPETKMYSAEDIQKLIADALKVQATEHETKMAAIEAKLAELTIEEEPKGVTRNPEGKHNEAVKLGEVKAKTPYERVCEILEY